MASDPTLGTSLGRRGKAHVAFPPSKGKAACVYGSVLPESSSSAGGTLATRPGCRVGEARRLLLSAQGVAAPASSAEQHQRSNMRPGEKTRAQGCFFLGKNQKSQSQGMDEYFEFALQQPSDPVGPLHSPVRLRPGVLGEVVHQPHPRVGCP